MKISTLRFLLLFVCLQVCCAGIYAQPTVVSFSPSPICPGTTLTITGTNFTQPGYTINSVSIGAVNQPGFAVVNSTTITVPVAYGTATAVVNVTYSGTTSGTATSGGKVTINPSYTSISISPSTLTGICQNTNTTLTATTTPSTTPLTWAWSGPGFSGGTTSQSAIATLPTSGTETYTVIATYPGTGSCPITGTVTGTVTAGPGIITITPNATTDCYGSLNSYTATAASASGLTINVHGGFETSSTPVDSTYWAKTNTSSGGTPANATWYSYVSPYLYSKAFSFFGGFFKFTYDWTFTGATGTSRFFLSNSAAQNGGTTATTLTSALFSTSGFSTLALNFYQNLRVGSGDKGEVQLSTTGLPGSFTTIQTFNAQQGTEVFTGTSGSFFGGTLHIKYNEGMTLSTVTIPTSWLGLTTVYLRFQYSATSSNGFGSASRWWAIDDVTFNGAGGAAPTWAWAESPTTPVTLFQDATYQNKYTGQNLATVYSALFASKTYTATATVGGCSNSGTATATISSTPIWTGYTDVDWNKATNWCNNVVPTSATSVIVPAGTLNSPQLSANGVVGSLQLDAGATIDLNGHDFALNGAVTGNGSFTGSPTSTLTANNGASGTIYFTPDSTSPFTTNYLKSLTLNSGSNISLGDSLNITAGTTNPFGTTSGSITVNSGGTLIAEVAGVNSGFLTLKSNIFGDAQVAQSSGTITSANSVSVERYIPAGTRAWRFLSVPFVSSSQTIRDAWQEGATPDPDIYTHNNPKPGFGTQITYAQGTTAFGYDENTTANPSIKTWNASGSSWATLPQSVPANDGTNTPIISYPAYCLFIRGSRNVDLQNAVNATVRDATTLRITGGLRVGPQTINYATAAGTAVLIGNPYAAPIDILTVLSNNSGKFTANKFWVWAPAYSGTDGVGGYLTWSGGMLVPSGTGYTGSHYAQSGQAFMLEATNGGTTGVSFTESCKYTNEASVFSATAVQLQKHPAVFTNLMLPSGDSLILVDGVGAGFGDQYSARVDKDDVAKLWNFNENIALVRDSATLAIEHRPIPVLTDTLYYRLYLAQKPYALKIFSQDIPTNLPAEAWLVDKYLNTKTAVNLNDTTLYNFTPNTDTNSYRNRFMLVFNRKPVTRADNPGTTGGANSIEVYPNPIIPGAKAMLKLNDLPKGNYEITVINSAGNILKKKTFVHAGGSSTYDIQTGSRWVAGNYVLKITGENGYSFSTNLVVGK